MRSHPDPAATVPSFPRRAWVRIALMLLATLLGCAAGCLAFVLLFNELAARGDPSGATSFRLGEGLRAGLFVCGYGSVFVFPGVLLWLALGVPASARIARIAPALGFGAASGAVSATVIWFFVGAGARVLDASSTVFFAAIGAVVGAATWTAYVLLARGVGARGARRGPAAHA